MLCQIVCSIRRYLSEKNLGDQELNPFDSTDKTCSFVLQSIEIVVWVDVVFLLHRFRIFCSALNAEMNSYFGKVVVVLVYE